VTAVTGDHMTSAFSPASLGYGPKPSVAADLSTRKRVPTRNIQISWLNASGQCDFREVLLPALPEFELAFNAFARGTLLATPSGFSAIEDLAPGDLVLTREFGPQPLTWIGSLTHVPNAPVWRQELARLVRFLPDALGVDRPHSNLLLGPGARLWQSTSEGGVFVPAHRFLDGETALEISPTTPVDLFHVMTKRHATLSAAHLGVESYHPGLQLRDRMNAANLSYFLTLFPHLTTLEGFGPVVAPRQAYWNNAASAAA
jgi:hypothetical protein